MRHVHIGDRDLAVGPPYLIAEAGVNHNGKVDEALELIDVAVASGADAVKFQMFEASTLVRPDGPVADYQKAIASTQFELLTELELDRGEFVRLADHASAVGIEFLCTPFSIDAASFLINEIGVPATKIGSGDLTYSQLLRHVSGTGQVVLLSTGMATSGEIRRALKDLEDADVVLLHCISQYPAPSAQANMSALGTLRAMTGDPVGLSDHFTSDLPSVMAVALGARVIERHFTLDKTASGPDHAASMDPGELREWVARMHETHGSLGDSVKEPQPAERDIRVVSRRSITAARDLEKGAVLEEADLGALRPEDGISPQRTDDLIGRHLLRSLEAGQPINWSDVSEAP